MIVRVIRPAFLGGEIYKDVIRPPLTPYPACSGMSTGSRRSVYCNGFDRSITRQQLGKHDPTRNNVESCVFYVVCATQQYSAVFSVRGPCGGYITRVSCS
jgi:hypothetical protein